MKLTASLLSLGLGALQAIASPVPEAGEIAARAPTLYLCGDSTMARGNGVIDGWGQYINKYVTIGVVNKAIGGRSARSYTNEGRFQEVANLVKAGDIVVIEFGHNDGGSPNTNDNGRSACPGQGTEVCTSPNGEKVYTFPFYIIQASKLLTAKGATVVLSTQTPNNAWENNQFNPAAPRFVGYQKVSKDALASTAVTLVDHFEAVIRMYKRLGSGATNALYPNDHTHTSPYGADLSAQAFAQAILQKMNGTTSLAPYLKSGNPTVY